MIVDRLRQMALCRRLPQPLGQVIQHRQVQQRFAAEEGQHESLGVDPVHLALDPGRDPVGGLERHLVGRLVVVAVVALVAVVAGEVALQGRQHRDVQLACDRS